MGKGGEGHGQQRGEDLQGRIDGREGTGLRGEPREGLLNITPEQRERGGERGAVWRVVGVND